MAGGHAVSPGSDDTRTVPDPPSEFGQHSHNGCSPVELPRLEGWARDALHRFLQQWKEYCQKCAVNSQNAVGLATLLTEQQLNTFAKMTDKLVGSITNKDVEEFIKERLKTGPSDSALTWLHITNTSVNLRVKKDGTGPVMEWF